ncbi:MAG: hypothetical protein Q9227_008892 [Pyrenula ochraceoflavens]
MTSTCPPLQPSGEFCPFDSTVRTVITDTTISIYGWPSLGGVIILDDVEAIDFDFLGLDRLNPPLRRSSPLLSTINQSSDGRTAISNDQDSEDTFCRQLLLLGAKWWDSEFRYSLVSHLEACANGSAPTSRLFGYIDISSEPKPTMREKRWVKVGWPSLSNGGGLWVSEFDTTFAGVDEENNLLPFEEGSARLKLAKTMDERCATLRDHFGGTFYPNVEDYKEGYTFLKSWSKYADQKNDRSDEKIQGEVGPLLTPEETVKKWGESF